jgi:multidrug resistance efflux pump
MHPNPRVIIPVAVVIVLALVMGAYLTLQQQADSRNLTVSGTIEATEIHLGSTLGGRVKEVYVNEGDPVEKGQALVDVNSSGGPGSSGFTDKIISPIDGVVLDRLFEVGEIAPPGATVVIVADLNTLTLTVYVSEDRYGKIALGQTYTVSVDSFPGEVFTGTVTHIATQAEFTPHNVQTAENRKTTVFAIKLALQPSGGKLKPGMPADVRFDTAQ